MKEKLWERTDFLALLDGMDAVERKKRHDVRYACFRMQTYSSGGEKAEKKHLSLAKKIEKLDGFGGWGKFARTWDISTALPIKLVQRKWSIYEEWNQTLRRVSEPLPGTEDGGESNV